MSIIKDEIEKIKKTVTAKNPYDTVIQDVLKVKKDETVLIIANPATVEIAQGFFHAVNEVKGKPSLIFQNDKTSFDNAEPSVLAAIGTNPDVAISVSNIKLGKDPQATANPYKTENGEEYPHIFDYLLDGKKSMRAVWTPGITEDIFNRTVNIDYEEISDYCEKLEKIFDGVQSIHVTAKGGTDIFIPVQGRKLLKDDGNFSMPGTGGNIPAGEVFISPNRGVLKDGSCTHGKIVFDGSMTFSDGDSILNTPIECTVVDGFVKEISGKEEAERLLKTITEAERLSFEYEKSGKIPSGMGKIYAENARNIGELGIGLNIFAKINGNMLEDEKAFSTCHFAIGENYDNDAPSLIHLDGLVRNPTITLSFKNSSDVTIMKDGKFIL